jgi:hypothetical protein
MRVPEQMFFVPATHTWPLSRAWPAPTSKSFFRIEME